MQVNLNILILIIFVLGFDVKRSHQSQTSYMFAQNYVDAHLGIEAPKEEAEVQYGSEKCNYGNEINPNVASQPPSKISWPTSPDALYTLAFVDLDPPSRKSPDFREWRHWVVVNIPDNDVAKGTVWTPYAGPTPPEGSGLHRYVFLIFQQNGRINRKDTLGDRGSWKVRDFAKNHDLKIIAGNYFQAQNP